MIISDRPPTENEVANATQHGIDLNVSVIGYDGLVVMVGKDRRVSSLGKERVSRILTREITEWGEAIGDSSMEYIEIASLSNYALIAENIITKGKSIDINFTLDPRQYYGYSDFYKTGLFISSYYYENEIAKDSEMKNISIDGISPTDKSIRDGSYPLVTRLYAAIRSNSTSNSTARMMKDWLVGAHGQQMIADMGYIPANKSIVPTADIINYPPEKNFPSDDYGLPDINMDFPRMDGSTSAQPLFRLIASRACNVPCAYEISEIWGTRMLVSHDKGPLGDYRNLYINTMTTAAGTHDGYCNLINGTADIIFECRLPSQDEKDFASSKGVDLILKPIALDAFIFILNPNNTVGNLTIPQIKDIYTKNITNWSEVGGVPAPITPYRRDENSGSQELMKELVLKGTEMSPDLSDWTLISMEGPFFKLKDDKDGICYTINFYAENIAPPEMVKKIGISGIYPTNETIRNRTYPLTAYVYAAIRADAAQSSIQNRLLDWLLSPDGQALVKESGYVPVK